MSRSVVSVILIAVSMCVSSSSSASAEDDAFRDRHIRKPRDKDGHNKPTPSPTSSRCTPNGDETYGVFYGDLSEIRVDIFFSYEIEVESFMSDNNEISGKVIPAVENAIIGSLARGFFLECADRNLRTSQKSRFIGTAISSHHGRSLELQGISTSRPYVKSCGSMQTVATSMCSHVKGGMSLYLDADTNDTDVETSVNQALLFIKNNMQSGTYINSYNGIVKIMFLGTDLIKYGNRETGNKLTIPSKSGDSNQSLKLVATYIIVGVVSISLIITIAMASRNLLSKTGPYAELDDNSGDLGADFYTVDSDGVDSDNVSTELASLETARTSLSPRTVNTSCSPRTTNTPFSAKTPFSYERAPLRALPQNDGVNWGTTDGLNFSTRGHELIHLAISGNPPSSSYRTGIIDENNFTDDEGTISVSLASSSDKTPHIPQEVHLDEQTCSIDLSSSDGTMLHEGSAEDWGVPYDKQKHSMKTAMQIRNNHTNVIESDAAASQSNHPMLGDGVWGDLYDILKDSSKTLKVANTRDSVAVKEEEKDNWTI